MSNGSSKTFPVIHEHQWFWYHENTTTPRPWLFSSTCSPLSEVLPAKMWVTSGVISACTICHTRTQGGKFTRCANYVNPENLMLILPIFLHVFSLYNHSHFFRVRENYPSIWLFVASGRMSHINNFFYCCFKICLPSCDSRRQRYELSQHASNCSI